MKDCQWLDWAQQLQAIAQNGLAYCKNDFDIERYHQLRVIAAQIMATGFDFDPDRVFEEFSSQVGYATPKVDVRAAVFEANKILLVQEKEDG